MSWSEIRGRKIENIIMYEINLDNNNGIRVSVGYGVKFVINK